MIHPNQTLLKRFGQGTLSPGDDLAVEMHIGLCDTCRNQTDKALLSADPPPGDSDARLSDTLAKVMQRLDSEPPAEQRDAQAQASYARYGAFNFPPWLDYRCIARPSHPTSGIWISRIALKAAALSSRTYLIGVKRGTVVPRHTHRGTEHTLVLQGSLVDQGWRYGPGDFIAAGETDMHSPEALEDCVCLVSSTSPIVMRTVLEKLIQPFIGI